VITVDMTIMPCIFVLGGTSMKAGTVGTHLHVVRAKRTLQSGKSVVEELPAEVEVGEEGETAWAAEQALIKRGVRAAQRWPQARNARVEDLRSLVQAGRYRIDGKVIAECLLNNETHFV
jgi:anti-sigma28 factor (negative regulator of flagellin synthesis)